MGRSQNHAYIQRIVGNVKRSCAGPGEACSICLRQTGVESRYNKTVANRARFHKALSRAEKAYPVREETDREAGWVLPSA
ncbi:hypothetical protein [Thermicanus aegyptius]|uniref:hypothetical protein n=1 Tax=Thermicanus aegyptius TaxID=94009 RepID=UPI0012EBC434|nr:hypothetical protein [Thermicanus aegyptius]